MFRISYSGNEHRNEVRFRTTARSLSHCRAKAQAHVGELKMRTTTILIGLLALSFAGCSGEAEQSKSEPRSRPPSHDIIRLRSFCSDEPHTYYSIRVTVDGRAISGYARGSDASWGWRNSRFAKLSPERLSLIEEAVAGAVSLRPSHAIRPGTAATRTEFVYRDGDSYTLRVYTNESPALSTLRDLIEEDLRHQHLERIAELRRGTGPQEMKPQQPAGEPTD